MRWLVLSITLGAAFPGMTCARAQDETLPYATHVDRRHGNDHVYPDRGAVIRDVPKRATALTYAGLTYRFAGGVWYQQLGPAYLVVEPPIGVTVPQLPAFATSLDSAGHSYLYANDVFYRALPDRGGYEVVNDPEDGAPAPSQEPADAAPDRMASASPVPPQSPAQPPEQPENDAPPPTSAAAVPSSDWSPSANPTGIAISPRKGQSEDRQAIDRYECYRYALTETGFDPLAMDRGVPPAEVARSDAEYSRAQAACLEGRGYDLP